MLSWDRWCDFYCNHNNLTTLKCCPQTVNGDFDCARNKLKSLNGLKYYENFYSDFSDEEVQAYYEEHYPEYLIWKKAYFLYTKNKY